MTIFRKYSIYDGDGKMTATTNLKNNILLSCMPIPADQNRFSVLFYSSSYRGFPRLPCKYIPCSDPYMGTDQPGTPVDPTKPIQGPYGTGMSGALLFVVVFKTFCFCLYISNRTSLYQRAYIWAVPSWQRLAQRVIWKSLYRT